MAIKVLHLLIILQRWGKISWSSGFIGFQFYYFDPFSCFIHDQNNIRRIKSAQKFHSPWIIYSNFLAQTFLLTQNLNIQNKINTQFYDALNRFNSYEKSIKIDENTQQINDKNIQFKKKDEIDFAACFLFVAR